MMDRREFIKKSALAGVAGIGLVKALSDLNPAAAAAQPELIVAEGGEPAALLAAALRAYGGFDKLIKPGGTVVIKTNFSWNGPPERACCTNPDLLAALVKACLKAGAKKVQVVDLSIDYSGMTMESSGIAKAVKAAGGEVFDLSGKNTVNKNSGILREFPVYTDPLKADCLLNVPILKAHFVTAMTGALKNYMGLTPDRGGMHALGTDQAIVDLAKVIKPNLHIVDAYRILMANGPQGGNPQDVAMPKQLVLSHDPVAADAYGAQLLKCKPLPNHVKLAAEAGLGTADLNKVKIRRIKV